MCASSGAETASLPENLSIHSRCFCGVRVAQSYVFCVMFIRSLFVLFFFTTCYTTFSPQIPFYTFSRHRMVVRKTKTRIPWINRLHRTYTVKHPCDQVEKTINFTSKYTRIRVFWPRLWLCLWRLYFFSVPFSIYGSNCRTLSLL
jgi:hypothetical protein